MTRCVECNTGGFQLRTRADVEGRVPRGVQQVSPTPNLMIGTVELPHFSCQDARNSAILLCEWQFYDEFWECPGCHKVFWEGTGSDSAAEVR